MVNALNKKIFGDVRENRMPFIAIICICSLGIALFSGINLYVGTMEKEVADYYRRANLADYWVYKAEISNTDLDNVRSMEIVNNAQQRKTVDFFPSGLSGTVLRIHALDETAAINMQEVLAGEPLDMTETSALLLDSRFAQVHGISVGDYLAVEQNGENTQWLVKGLIRSVEYAYYAPEGLTIPDYHKYGFAYTNVASLQQAPFNEIVLTVHESANISEEKIMDEIRETLGNANILSRHHQTSYRKINDALIGIKRIGVLFSIAFFLTAALVTWITVSRMMENQRQHLGTLRSLGFAKKELTSRYAIFGAVITIPSMIIGWVVARFLIAEFLYNIGITYYTIEKTGVDDFSAHFFFSVFCVAVVTYGAVAVSCWKTLQFTPAALMRPKPPAQGHRILLERRSFFWRRLSFSGKIVTRNLFRNKARLLMGLFGIIGSTSLILCGFGMMNSISAMQDKAFDKTVQYNVEIKLRTPLTKEQLSDVYDKLTTAQNIDATMAFSVYVYDESGSMQSPYLVILEDDQQSLSFADMNGNAVRLPENGALITPRMADALNVKIGDTLTARRIDGITLPLEVEGIVDFPVGNEIYMSKSAFSKASDLPFLIRTLLINGDGFNLDELKSDARISLVETKEEMRDNMQIVLEALQSIQIILIAFSGILAFAVMMVLGRMNYYERIRELATLKVLGFYKNEMKRLVLRENIWITLFGLPLGYGVGTLLLDAILKQATTPDLEIVPYITGFSITLGFAFMLAFTMLVNHIMGVNFKGIDMVASLKSVE